MCHKQLIKATLLINLNSMMNKTRTHGQCIDIRRWAEGKRHMKPNIETVLIKRPTGNIPRL